MTSAKNDSIMPTRREDPTSTQLWFGKGADALDEEEDSSDSSATRLGFETFPPQRSIPADQPEELWLPRVVLQAELESMNEEVFLAPTVMPPSASSAAAEDPLEETDEVLRDTLTVERLGLSVSWRWILLGSALVLSLAGVGAVAFTKSEVAKSEVPEVLTQALASRGTLALAEQAESIQVEPLNEVLRRIDALGERVQELSRSGSRRQTATPTSQPTLEEKLRSTLKKKRKKQIAGKKKRLSRKRRFKRRQRRRSTHGRLRVRYDRKRNLVEISLPPEGVNARVVIKQQKPSQPKHQPKPSQTEPH
ncbi:MAG: hypothetical protein JRH20_02430 [Deltaproteobacteria bacterium]|nr:hypothetical protein [Deltaproteobacteria bacterium]